MTRVLIIEDNELLAFGLKSNLEYEGYDVQVAVTGSDGLRLARDWPASLVVLDLMLPDTDGFRVLQELRGSGCDVPVLVLTALGAEADKVNGFRVGADDYVTKPFGLMELMARIASLLRRARSAHRDAAMTALSCGDVVINTATREVTRAGERIALRPKEYELLVALARRAGAIVSRLELLQDVWGYDNSVVSRTVDTHMAELRRKLEDDPTEPRYLLTVRKAGYRLGG